MTRTTKVHKRSVKKSTPEVAEVKPKVAENVSEVTLSDLSYRDLQAEAKLRGLKASGTKADLIERLA